MQSRVLSCSFCAVWWWSLSDKKSSNGLCTKVGTNFTNCCSYSLVSSEESHLLKLCLPMPFTLRQLIFLPSKRQISFLVSKTDLSARNISLLKFALSVVDISSLLALKVLTLPQPSNVSVRGENIQGHSNTLIYLKWRPSKLTRLL